MSPDTIRRRKSHGIPLDRPLNYRRKWLARMPDIRRFCIEGHTISEIAAYYGEPPSSLGMAMQYHGVRALDLRRENKRAMGL